MIKEITALHAKGTSDIVVLPFGKLVRSYMASCSPHMLVWGVHHVVIEW